MGNLFLAHPLDKGRRFEFDVFGQIWVENGFARAGDTTAITPTALRDLVEEHYREAFASGQPSLYEIAVVKGSRGIGYRRLVLPFGDGERVTMLLVIALIDAVAERRSSPAAARPVAVGSAADMSSTDVVERIRRRARDACALAAVTADPDFADALRRLADQTDNAAENLERRSTCASIP